MKAQGIARVARRLADNAKSAFGQDNSPQNVAQDAAEGPAGTPAEASARAALGRIRPKAVPQAAAQPPAIRAAQPPGPTMPAASGMAGPPTMPDKPAIDATVKVGLGILSLFFGGLVLWGLLAPLSSAAVAPGVVIVDSNRKTVQHLEGGIIRAIQVDNGDTVRAGQVLVRLDDAQAAAGFNQIRGRLDALEALEARLVAERDGLGGIAFPEHLLARRGDPQVAEILSGQQTIFEQRRRTLAGQTDILNQRVVQLEKEIDSRRAQIAAAKRQSLLISEEIAGVNDLVEKGLERRSRLLALQRQQASLEGQRGEQLGLVARAEQQIGEAELQIISQKNAQMNAVVGELRDIQTQLGDMAERAAAARDVLERREIVSPINGTVVDMKFFTAGGVIGPGEPIMDIVPENDELVIEAQVQPIDIDVVQTGLKAQVTLTAFKQRTTPTLDGRVSYVSADSLTDPRTGLPYFSTRIEIPADEMERLGGLELNPGMPAQVMIVTGERTAFQYLFDPLRESMQRAFREE